MRVFVYVDGDNVGTDPIAIISLLNKYDTLIAQFRLYFSFEDRGHQYSGIFSKFPQFRLIVMSLCDFDPVPGSRTIVPRSYVRPDQLDFLIAYDVHLVRVEDNSNALGVIVSRDGGFDVLVPYLRLQDRTLFQVDSLQTLDILLQRLEQGSDIRIFEGLGILRGDLLGTNNYGNYRKPWGRTIPRLACEPTFLEGSNIECQDSSEFVNGLPHSKIDERKRTEKYSSESVNVARRSERAKCECCRVIRTDKVISYIARRGMSVTTMSELHNVVRACYPHADYARIQRAIARLEARKVVRVWANPAGAISVHVPARFPLHDLPRDVDEQIALVQHYLSVACPTQRPPTLERLQERLSRIVKGGLSTGQVECLIRNLLDAGIVQLRGRSVIYALGN